MNFEYNQWKEEKLRGSAPKFEVFQDFIPTAVLQATTLAHFKC